MYNKSGYFYFIDSGFMEQQPFRLIDFGIEQRKKENYDFDNRGRAQYGGYLFQYTLEGTGCFETEGKQILLVPESAFLVKMPDDSRYYLPGRPESDWKLFFVHFDGTAAVHMVDQIQKLVGKVMQLSVHSSAVTAFLEEFEAVRSGKQYKRYESGEWVYRFLTALLRDIETPHAKESKCVEEAILWMQHNYSTQQNLSDMCQTIGVSLPHLTRQFHREQGIIPQKYLMKLRLEKAASLLRNTSLKVDQVATKSGFSCGNYFAKVFRNEFHTTPTLYRESIQGN